MWRWLWILAVSWLCMTVTPAQSAQIEVIDEADGLRLILLTGEITSDDPARFGRAILGAEKVVVALSSPGGNLLAGIQLGRVIRIRGYRTLVPGGSRCASACALAWLAGTPRHLQPNSLIGFHAAYDRRDMQVSSVGNALTGHYLAEIGLPSRAVVYITEAAPREMTWLTPTQAQANGIDVAMIAGTGGSARNPSPLPQAPPARAHAALSLPDMAINFVRRLYAITSEDNEAALHFLASAYASQVSFYGGMQGADAILRQKRQFLERWPLRVYIPRADTIQASCDEGQRTCSVTGIIDWDARSPTRAAASAGVSNFAYDLFFPVGRQPYITGENGRVLSRQAPQ